MRGVTGLTLGSEQEHAQEIKWNEGGILRRVMADISLACRMR